MQSARGCEAAGRRGSNDWRAGGSRVPRTLLAHELRLGAGGSDPAIEERYRKAQDAVDAAAQQTTPKLFLGGGVVLIVVGLMLALLMPLAGVPLVVLGGALVAWSVSRNGRNAPPDVAAELKAAKQARGEQQARSESSLRLRQAAMERARLAGLDADPDTMEQLAGRSPRQRRASNSGQAGIGDINNSRLTSGSSVMTGWPARCRHDESRSPATWPPT